ncbi:MAG: hypothetical protein HY666_04600 [Chloroflexi bacterium]|nr:hypothetical protein [Chloroflexota bacterium]
MNQKDIRVVIPLTPQEVELITRPVAGEGGFQSLLRTLKAQIEDDSLVLNIPIIRRIVRYKSKYGGGGYQQRLAAVLAALGRLADALRIPYSGRT